MLISPKTFRFVRQSHLYFGVFIAPALIFFAFTGALQTFNLHEASRTGDYKPPAWAVALGQLHKKQTLTPPTRRPGFSPDRAADRAGGPVKPDHEARDTGSKPAAVVQDTGKPEHDHGNSHAENAAGQSDRLNHDAGHRKPDHDAANGNAAPAAASSAATPNATPQAAPTDAAKFPAGPQSVPAAATPQRQKSHLPMKIFFLLASIGLFWSTVTGIIMAYKYDRNKLVITALLIAGIVVPLALLPF